MWRPIFRSVFPGCTLLRYITCSDLFGLFQCFYMLLWHMTYPFKNSGLLWREPAGRVERRIILPGFAAVLPPWHWKGICKGWDALHVWHFPMPPSPEYPVMQRALMSLTRADKCWIEIRSFLCNARYFSILGLPLGFSLPMLGSQLCDPGLHS